MFAQTYSYLGDVRESGIRFRQIAYICRMTTLIITPRSKWQEAILVLLEGAGRLFGLLVRHESAPQYAARPLADAFSDDEPDYDPTIGVWQNPEYTGPLAVV